MEIVVQLHYGSTGRIETTGINEIMRILNGGDINFYSDNLGNTPTLEIKGSNGQIEMKGGGNLEIKNGGDIEVYDGNDVKRMELVSADGDLKLYNESGSKTFDIDGSVGDLKIYNPNNGSERIELDGNTGNVIINDGGRIDMFLGNNLNIELNGVNGIIDCRDIDIRNHSGLLTLDRLRCDTFNTNRITLPEDPSTPSDYEIVIDTDGINLIGTRNITIDYGNFDTANGSIFVRNGGKIELFSDTNTTKQVEIFGNNGNISANGLVSGNSFTTDGNITATGTSGFIGVGTNADTYNILLNKDGEIECEDLTLNNHTGSITFNEIKTDKIELPKTGTADIILDGSTGDLTLTNGDLEVINGNSVFRGGADFIGNNSVDFIDSSTTLQFRMNPSTGDFTASTGDITATDGNIIATGGTLRSNKVGSKPAPEDSSSYTDWALSLSTSNSHAFIGGNLICDGTIYANVEGTITEEVIDAQRLNIRTDPSGETSGNTEINFGGGNMTINQDGDIEYLTDQGLISGYFDTGNTGTTYESYSTPVKHLRLDSTNYKNHRYEIGVNIPNTIYLERTISSTSTSWIDLNDRLSCRLISNGETITNFVVDFSFYAVLTAGSRLWLKLFDSSTSQENFYQPAYFNNTMSQCFLDTNGGSDFAGVHNVRFLVQGFPSNTTKVVRVCAWVITSSGHKVIFKTGGRVLGNTSINPSTTFDKYPPMVLQAHKLLGSTGVNNQSPTGWTDPSQEDY